jgi:hypothetical protein
VHETQFLQAYAVLTGHATATRQALLKDFAAGSQHAFHLSWVSLVE